MDKWSTKCKACGVEIKVIASSMEDAIYKAEKEHLKTISLISCGTGSCIDYAHNLDNHS